MKMPRIARHSESCHGHRVGLGRRQRGKAVEPELPPLLEGFPAVGGNFLNAADALFDEDDPAQCAVPRGEVESLVVGGFVDHENNHVVVVRGRDIEALHLSSIAEDALNDGTLLFVGQAKERGNVRWKLRVDTIP